MTHADRCRCCGRTPEDILRSAVMMRTIGAAVVVAGELRTRWRRTVAGTLDFICWFCSLYACRFEDRVLAGAFATLSQRHSTQPIGGIHERDRSH